MSKKLPMAHRLNEAKIKLLAGEKCLHLPPRPDDVDLVMSEAIDHIRELERKIFWLEVAALPLTNGMTVHQITKNCLDSRIVPEIEKLYRSNGNEEAFIYIHGLILGLAGAAEALGGADAIKLVIDHINQAADEFAQDDMVRS